MKIIKIDRRNNSFEAVPDSFDDLWHIEKLIEPGDVVSGSSERKIKPVQEGDKPRRERVFVEIEAEDAKFHEGSGQLRVQGIVVAAKPEELVPLKSHHTLEVEAGAKITVKKKALRNYDVERLERAKDATGRESVIVAVMDDEEAEVYAVRDAGADLRARILSGREGKRFGGSEKKGKDTYFEEILGKISGARPKKILVAGPGFEKQRLEKYMKDNGIKLPAVFESTNDVGESGLNELMKSGKIDRLVEGMHSAQEAKSVERVLASLGSGMAALGIKEVKEAVAAGAADEIVVLDRMLTGRRAETGEMLDAAEGIKARIVFVSTRSDAGKKLDGLGGVAAVLRYRVKW